MDDYIRALSAFIAQLNANKSNLASPTFTGTVTVPVLTATTIGSSGNISSSGVLSGASISTSGTISATGNVSTSGQVTASGQVSFYAQNGGATGAAYSNTVIVNTAEQHDTTGAHNTSTGKFTAPVAGRYLIHGGGQFGASGTGNGNSTMFIRVNGTTSYSSSSISIPVGQTMQHATCAVLNLSAADYVELVATGTATISAGLSSCYFTGYLLG
jgi:hypothetical protein